MTQKYPLITVAVSTYRSLPFIEKCLKSIKSQTYPNIEIIVVDALQYNLEEQKKCKEIIKKYAVYLQDGPERCIQRNRGIKEAKGEYIYFLDQDMYLRPDVVMDCYEHMIWNQFVGLTIPEISIGDGFWTKCVALDRYVSNFLEESMNSCSRFFRTEDVRNIGGYDPDIVGAEDADFHYRIQKLGKIGKTKAFVYHDEQRVKFWSRVKKKYYYSRAFSRYLKKQPLTAIGVYFPLKPAYFKHPLVLFRQPGVALGMIMLRTAEIIAGAFGVVFNQK
jgi:glycosyltransferase involved in cell wall biosynthesis